MISRRHESRLINRLRLSAGGVVTMAELIRAIWPGVTRRPGYLERKVATYVMDLRRQGFPIANEFGRGYRFKATLWQVEP